LAQKSREESVVSGGHLVAKALRNEGVDTIFTLCGGHIIDIYDGCIDEGIRIIDVRHEQVAAHAADGYARQTGGLESARRSLLPGGFGVAVVQSGAERGQLGFGGAAGCGLLVSLLAGLVEG